MDSIKLTKSQLTAVDLFNEKLALAQRQVDRVMEQAKLFLQDLVSEAGKNPKDPWSYNPDNGELTLE